MFATHVSCVAWNALTCVCSLSCPAGFAVLHYKGANESLPTTKTPQPGSVQPWTFEQEAKIVASSALLQASDAGVCSILENLGQMAPCCPCRVCC